MFSGLTAGDNMGPQTRAVALYEQMSIQDQLRLILAFAMLDMTRTSLEVTPERANEWNTLIALGFVRYTDDPGHLKLTDSGKMAVVKLAEKYVL